MLLIGIALLVAAGLALAIGSDVGAQIGLTQMQTAGVVPLLIILVLVASSLFARRRPVRELVGGLALWIGLFGVAVTGYAYRADILSVAARVYGELTPGQALVDPKTGEVGFRRGLSGHFEVESQINDAKIRLIFDTGASAVVLTPQDARRAGLDIRHLTYDTAVSTANGMGKAASVSLKQIDIGGIVRHNIRAYVTEDGAMDTSLLGMTFLETLTRYAVTRDSLELTN